MENQVLVLGGILIANAAAIVGSFVSLKIAVAEIKIMMSVHTARMDSIEKDLNNLGEMYRSQLKKS